MIINIGDIIASEFGEGPVVAITKDWVVHDCGNGSEAAIPKDDGQFWIIEPEYMTKLNNIIKNDPDRFKVWIEGNWKNE